MTQEASAPPLRLDGKVALVTGAGSGIGEQIARLFARQGAAVVIGDVDEAGGSRVAAAIGQAGLRARYQPLDVSDASSAAAAVRACVEGFGGLHILVNCICPGTIDTPFVDAYLDRFHGHNRDETLASLHARQPMGRMGRPEEIAYAALYLAADEASFTTGSEMVVDGGLTAQ